MMDGCRLAVDIGGTFTDVVLETPTGFFSGKVLTTAGAPEEGVVRAIALVLGKAGVTPDRISLTIHGTTLGTNGVHVFGGTTVILENVDVFGFGTNGMLAEGTSKVSISNSVFNSNAAIGGAGGERSANRCYVLAQELDRPVRLRSSCRFRDRKSRAGRRRPRC